MDAKNTLKTISWIVVLICSISIVFTWVDEISKPIAMLVSNLGFLVIAILIASFEIAERKKNKDKD
ncbi:MAG: hypothetical protein IIU55_03785 [Paludibacteraceae bacterium]|jgi:membrane protein YdbS with pleckstrin-like domain|nr:hypothetical protein [Paludibacteraceae bacterium]